MEWGLLAHTTILQTIVVIGIKTVIFPIFMTIVAVPQQATAMPYHEWPARTSSSQLLPVTARPGAIYSGLAAGAAPCNKQTSTDRKLERVSI